MPAITFFSMLVEGRKLKAIDRIEQCDIAYIPAAEVKFYNFMRDHWKALALPEETEQEIVTREKSTALKAESQEAKYAVMGIFAAAKGMIH